MCLAIWKPKGVQIKLQYLKNGFENNSDGAGIAWADKQGLHIEKGFFKAEELIEAYKEREKLPMLIHFRWATHGAKTKEFCHPFLVGEHYAAIHNGVLNIKVETGGSDTETFCRLVLSPLAKHIEIHAPLLRYLVEQAIGSGNKIAVLDQKGKCTIFNESAGEWHHGCWFSNGDYKSVRKHTYMGMDFGEDFEDWRKYRGAVVSDYTHDYIPTKYHRQKYCNNCGTDFADVTFTELDECPYCGADLYNFNYNALT